jgi:hypothetical protein
MEIPERTVCRICGFAEAWPAEQMQKICNDPAMIEEFFSGMKCHKCGAELYPRATPPKLPPLSLN